MRAQVALEALVLFAGLLAFWAAWFSVIMPVQEKAKNEAVTRLEQAAFERVSFALRLAQRFGRGTKISERVYLPVETNVTLSDGLKWIFANQTWRASCGCTGATRSLKGSWTAVAENTGEVVLSWRD